MSMVCQLRLMQTDPGGLTWLLTIKHRAWGEDPVISKVLGWVIAGEHHLWKNVTAEGRHWSVHACHYGQNLNRQCSLDGELEECLRLVTPKPLHKEIIQHLCKKWTAGHLGVCKTNFNVRRRFWWPDLMTNVKHWCQECQPWQFRNWREGRRHHKLHQEPAGSPMERMAIDIWSFQTEIDGGTSDYFTKWNEAFTLPKYQAMSVADVLVTEIFLGLSTIKCHSVYF